ncbi:MAG: hypothetical protein HRU11_01960 [Parvularculaceae bacterium]|nr:hypothetical protein [Parvularculaceae bacterium]
MTRDGGQRSVFTVRLLGRQAQTAWRQSLISEGFAIPSSGECSVCLADVSGSQDPDAEIAGLLTRAGTTPLVVRLGLNDPLPLQSHEDVIVVRALPQRTEAVTRALRRAIQGRLHACAAAIRLQGIASLGHNMPVKATKGDEAPAAILTEPHPVVLSMLSETGWKDLVAPLTSSQTLRLLENNHASALVVHLGAGLEHRLPIVKLIRRQTDLRSLPIAAITEDWDDDAVDQWSEAGVDLIATNAELPKVLTFLKGAGARFRSQRVLTTTLATGTINDEGRPAPFFGTKVFDRIVAEHQARGDALAFGAIELGDEVDQTDNELSEAGVYMTMALAPLDFMCRPRPNVYLFAMPYADRFYASKVMRTMQTLVEDLKFGEDPSPVLMNSRHSFIDGGNCNAAEALNRLEKILAKPRKPAIIA